MMLIEEDYEVVTEDTKLRLTDLMSLPKVIYNPVEGFYELSIRFLHPTYVEISYTQKSKILVQARLNLSIKLLPNLDKLMNYLEDKCFLPKDKLIEGIKLNLYNSIL